MRIGLLTTSFPRRDGDVAGQFVLGFARALAARGHVIEVLAPEPSQAVTAPSWPGVSVRFVPYIRPRRAARTFYGDGVPDNLRRDPLAWLGLAPFCLSLAQAAARHGTRWDALVSHWALPCALIAGAVRGDRPHLAVLHSADLHLLSRLPQRARFSRALANAASELVFVSTPQRASFLRDLPQPVAARAALRSSVQPMGIDPWSPPDEERTASRRRLGLDRFTLLSLSRLVPVKGLCQAVSALREREDLEWLIAGEGPERSRLEALARNTRIRVRLLGHVDSAEKRALLHAADAFVLPSRVLRSGRTEGVPTALLEAMAAGLPVLATDVGGVRDVVRDLDTGLLLPPHDARALGHGIDRLIAEPRLAAELASRAQSEASQHQWCALAPRFESLLARDRASAAEQMR
jgi:glycosyltransferase involved in cell wall biosynthesis